jgi:gas vesicle protein
MEEERFSWLEFGLGLVAGAALGATAGVLLAPQSGFSTRKEIARSATSLRYSAEELISQAKQNIEMAASKVEGALGLEERSVKKKLDEIKEELEKYELKQG